jgi:hypothetical protein
VIISHTSLLISYKSNPPSLSIIKPTTLILLSFRQSKSLNVAASPIITFNHIQIFDAVEPGLFVSLTNGSFVGANM